MGFDDIIAGKRFGGLTAVEFVGHDGRGQALWRFKCECGHEKITRAYSARSGMTKSCGCLTRRPKAHNIAGLKFGRLTAIERVGRDSNRNARWRFKCDCGQEIVVLAMIVKAGDTRSCGCLRQDWLKACRARTSAKSGQLDSAGIDIPMTHGTIAE
jgi:hypothetical protein